MTGIIGLTKVCWAGWIPTLCPMQKLAKHLNVFLTLRPPGGSVTGLAKVS